MRTLKDWLKEGRDRGDPVPLDRPADMPGWWQRNRRHPVPPALWEAAGWVASGRAGALAGGVPGVVPPAGMDPPARAFPPGAVPVPTTTAAALAEDPQAAEACGAGLGGVVSGEGVEPLLGPGDGATLPQGLDEELERLEGLAARLSVSAHQPGRTKSYLDTVARLTSLTGKLREEAERRRFLIPKDEAERCIHEMHGPLEREIRLMARPMAESLGVPMTPAFEKRWSAECDRLCGRLKETVFS